MTRNPFKPAARAGLLRRMEQDGCETFSDKVRWVEEHMPNVDDPAAFVGALVRRNPVDAAYTEPLGEGAFSKAYGKPDELARFYDGLDRGPRAVETLTQREVDRYPWMEGAKTTIDVSKLLLIEARKLLKGNKKAQAYLPTIEPVRIDYTKKPELIYAMPVYRTLQEIDVFSMPAEDRQLYFALSDAAGKRAPIDETVYNLSTTQAKKHPALRAQIGLLCEVLTAIENAADNLPFSVQDLSMDIHKGNVAIDANVHLVLLDPIVAVAELSDVEDYWQKAGWPGGPVSGKKLPRKAKNPPQPELFKESRRVTVTRDDLAKHRPWAQEALRLIETAYASIGGHANLKSVDAILADDADVYRFEDLDSDQEPDVLQVFKTTPYGLKSIATGNTGSRESKRATVLDKIEDFRQFGNYGEVSERLAKILLDAGVPVIGDKRIVEKVLNKKVEWVGLDPEFPSVYGWYERVIGGHKHRKILVGLPDVVRNPALAALRKAGAR